MNSPDRFKATPPSESAEEIQRRRRLELLRMKSTGLRPEASTTHSNRERNNEEKSGSFRGKYLEMNPGDTAGGEIAAGLASMFENRKRLHSGEVRTMAEKILLVKKMAEFNAHWTEYVHAHKDDEVFLKRHWKVMEKMARESGEESSYRMTRSGIITQVATMRIFEKLKLQHKSSTVEEDAVYKIDMWLQNEPVQIKTGPEAEHVEIVEANTASPLHVSVTGGQREALISSAAVDEALGFRFELNRYAEELHRPSLRGFFIIIPKKKINYYTGKPEQQLIDEVEAELRRLKYLPESPEVPVAAAA